MIDVELKYYVRFYDEEHDEWHTIETFNQIDAFTYWLLIPEECCPIILRKKWKSPAVNTL